MPDRFDPRSLRAEARELIRTGRVPPLRFTALYLAVTLGLSLADAVAGRFLGGVTVFTFSLTFVDILVSLVVTVLSAGCASYCLCVARGEETPFESLLDAFPIAGKVVALAVLQGLLIGAGLTLFVVPGVVLAMAYGLALFHLLDDPEIGVFEAMRRSRMEMRGRKAAFFLLHVGFLPLLVLAAAAMLFCPEVLSPVFPDTLAGDLLYVFVSGVITAAAELYLRAWLGLSRALFYRRVTEAAETEGEE